MPTPISSPGFCTTTNPADSGPVLRDHTTAAVTSERTLHSLPQSLRRCCCRRRRMTNREFNDIHVDTVTSGGSLIAAFAADLSSKHPTAT